MALLEVSFFSNQLGMNMTMNVILPQQEQNQIGIESSPTLKDIPVVYLLHGMSDDQSIWLRRTSIERYAAEYGFAVIMPTTHLGWYTNTKYGLRYWDFIAKELPAICHGFFPQLSTKKTRTFAAGLSMGGYGAFKLGLREPESFQAVASLSGALGIANEANFYDGNETFWKGIFGEFHELQHSENDLFDLAKTAADNGVPLPKFYLWCGEKDFLYQQNKAFETLGNELGVDLTSSYSEGDHNWYYWDKEIQPILKWFHSLMN